MASIGKIQLGKKDKRAYFNMSHDVNSTLSFGFFEPTCCLDVVPNTKLDFKAMPGVRLAPLPQPTTGLVSVHNYYSFVKTKEVFEAFENLQSGTVVSSSRGQYTPVNSNIMSNFDLFACLLLRNSYAFNNLVNGSSYTNRNLNSVFFNFSIHSNYDLTTGEDTTVHNLFDDVKNRWANFTATGNEGYKAMTAFFSTVNSVSVVASHYLGNILGSYCNLAVREGIYAPYFFPTAFAEFLPVLKNTTEDYSSYPFGPLVSFSRNLKKSDGIIFSQGRSYENADFIFEVPFSFTDPSDSTSYVGHIYKEGSVSEATEIQTDGKKLYIGIHLTPAGKRLFKIFNCIGVNFGQKVNVEMDKLLAYYKAWFDIFNPGRTVQWKATNAYMIIHSFYDSPSFNWTSFSSQYRNGGNYSDWVVKCFSFFIDLSECYFTDKVDPITVATNKPVLDTTNDGISTLRLYANGDNDIQDLQRGYGSNDDEYGGLSVRFLQSLYHLVNKNTVIGHRVALYMKEHFGVDIPKTSFIEKKSFDINIVDAVGTVNNDSTMLGEYAGIGKGKSVNGVNFECDDFGYFFQFTVVVPRGGYVQAGKLAKYLRLDWYQPAYDSLGMEPISQYEVNSRNSIPTTWNGTNAVFGFRPRYFSMKYQNNLANGGFSFRSERSQFLGYSLDKVFSEPDFVSDEQFREGSQGYSDSYVGALRFYPGVTLAPDEELRYIGKNQSYGNYNRIFYDTTGITDNFILYLRNEVKMYAPMKAISQSYEAYDETSDTDTVNVEHS